MVDIEKGIKAYSKEGLAEFMKSAGMLHSARSKSSNGSIKKGLPRMTK